MPEIMCLLSKAACTLAFSCIDNRSFDNRADFIHSLRFLFVAVYENVSVLKKKSLETNLHINNKQTKK